MAASTSTANPNNDYLWDFDVFVSHRGPDTKETFATSLYRRLLPFGLRVFLDQPELQRGDFIKAQIESAIKTASVQVAIFSPGYADSEWCLDELVSMLKTGATIIPIFYKVQPSDLRWTRNNDGVYTKALDKLGKKSRYDCTQIEEWRKALSQVSNISGFELKACNTDEEKLLAEVVEGVLARVKRKTLHVADYPTGLDDKVKDFVNKILSQRQHSAKPQVVGIVGPGGVGKTTLAKQLFNLKSIGYGRSCFLPDIRENATTPSLISLQNKLINKLSRVDLKIDDINVGITNLEKHLSSDKDKVLVILDDVDDKSQVNALLPVNTVLHPESLILITSRNIDVLTSSRVEESLIYPLTGLDTKYSRELFCWHSFSHPHPPLEFESLVDKFLKVCDGLPLSLTVFGALLVGRDGAYWTEQHEKLQNILPHKINERLKISYDALEKQEKEIFLDIACFFTRYNRLSAIRIWDGPGCKARLSFEKLQSRCLVRVDSENDIQMHNHLRDMGREIAEDLGKSVGENLSRRFWRWTDEVIDDLWRRAPGIIVRGIKMDVSEYNEHKDALDNIVNVKKGFPRLQLLDTEEGILEHIMNWVLSPNLIWLRWRKCPHSSLRSCNAMKNLRVLQVAGSFLKTLWEETQPPEKLRELEIYAPLRNLPKSIGRLKHLERIVVSRYLSGRVNLIELPDEFCNLESLKALVLKECSRLKSLPNAFGKITTLEHIDLSFCRNLERLPDSFGRLMNLQQIDLSNCYDLKSLPDSFGSLGNLQRIDLRGCHKLKELPDSFGNMKKLQHIDLSDCHGLRRLPDSFGDLSNLKYIDLSGCHNLKSLPHSSGNLTNLQHINLSNCHDLETLPDSFDNLSNLQHIDLSRCHNLESLPNSLRNLNESKFLCLEGCSYLTM